MYHAQAFGVSWISDVPLPLFPSAIDTDSAHPVRVTLEAGSPPPALPRLSAHHKLQRLSDGLRYTTEDLVIDTHDMDRVLLYPGPGWSGALPFPFFATVTGLLLARRGLLPMHGCAVERDGKATLVCGPSGAGKSTLAASLLAHGARLLSDDLTVLHPDPAAGPPLIFAGRTAIRLHPDSARRLSQSVAWQAEPCMLEGKLAVFPPCVSASRPVPLGQILLLTPASQNRGPESKQQALEDHFFRPEWIKRIPGYTLRRAALAIATRSLPVQIRQAIDPESLRELWP